MERPKGLAGKSTDSAEKPVEKRPEKRRKAPRTKGLDRFAQKFVHENASLLFSTLRKLAPGYRLFHPMLSEASFPQPYSCVAMSPCKPL